MINFELAKIDSLRIVVPFADIEIVDSKLNQEFISYCPATSEIDESNSKIKLTTYSFFQGIKTKFGISSSIADITKEQYKCVVFSVNTKMLKQAYFDGINKDNIDVILNYINALNIIRISKETLLKAKVFDVDICIDLLLMNTTVKEVVSICDSLTIFSKTTSVNTFKQKTNVGIEWNTRNGIFENYKKKQFLKYYAKILEFEYNSIEFYNTFIKDNLYPDNLFETGIEKSNLINSDNVIRMETTIKNKTHFKTYGISCNLLSDLLNLDFNKYLEIFHRPISIYMSGYKTIKHNQNLSFADRNLLELLTLKADRLKLEPLEYVDTFVNAEMLILRQQDKSEKNLKVRRSQLKTRIIELIHIDKKIMIENKTMSNQISMLEITGFGLIPE
jgi:hypothetical protein